MRPHSDIIEPYRIRHGPMASDRGYGLNGAFLVPCGKALLTVIVSDGNNGDDDGWEHVSVSLPERCPTWDEMCHVKELFFRGDETVLQFHPQRSEYVNAHPFCLHLWRPTRFMVPLPPAALVGPKAPPAGV